MHVEMPCEMADYAQESGRAGVREAECSQGSTGSHRGAGQETGRVWGLLVCGRPFAGVCRRVVLDSEMDGRIDRVSCEKGGSGVTYARPLAKKWYWEQ